MSEVRPTSLGSLRLPGVLGLTSLEERRVVDLQPLAGQGTYLRDMGRRPAVIAVDGQTDAAGLEALAQLRGWQAGGERLPFDGALVEQVGPGEVVVDQLEVREDAREPGSLRYRLVLVEAPAPPEARVSRLAAASGLGGGLLPEGLGAGLADAGQALGRAGELLDVADEMRQRVAEGVEALAGGLDLLDNVLKPWVPRMAETLRTMTSLTSGERG